VFGIVRYGRCLNLYCFYRGARILYHEDIINAVNRLE